MRVCPGCKTDLAGEAMLCSKCLHDAILSEPERKMRSLALISQRLLVAFSLVLFAKGCWMGLAQENYSAFVESVGYTRKEPWAYYLGSAFTITAALLYAVAWVGGFLNRSWRLTVGGAGLVVFGAGQVTYEMAALGGHPLPQAIAMVAVWLSIPVFQFILSVLGGEPYPDKGSAGDARGA